MEVVCDEHTADKQLQKNKKTKSRHHSGKMKPCSDSLNREAAPWCQTSGGGGRRRPPKYLAQPRCEPALCRGGTQGEESGVLAYLDEVVLLGAVLVEQASRGGRRHEEDGLEGDLALRREVDVSQGLLRVLATD